MSGPCSLPGGPKSRWEELNEIVCDIHYHCDMNADKVHDFITYRMWLINRGRSLQAKQHTSSRRYK